MFTACFSCVGAAFLLRALHALVLTVVPVEFMAVLVIGVRKPVIDTLVFRRGASVT